MRRIKILFFWLFKNKNNVSLIELLRFLVKPTIATIARKHVKATTLSTSHVVSFFSFNHLLHWPRSFSTNRLDQVISETFDVNDWHYYQKQHTEIAQDEILLDIGTAEGLFPLTVIDKCAHIHMVEPSNLFHDCLQKTFKDFTDKVTIHNVAVGNQDGEISFDENSLDGKIVADNEASTHQIAIRKIDTLLHDQKITYLKADIEGFEQEMLRGAERTIKKNKPKIAITTYHTQNDPNEIISIIKGFVPEYNYYVKGIYEETPKPVMIHFWI